MYTSTHRPARNGVALEAQYRMARSVQGIVVASLAALAGCAIVSPPPPVRPLPAAADAVPGSAPGPVRGAGSYTWSPQIDDMATGLRSALGSGGTSSGIEVSRTTDNRIWLLVSGDHFEPGRGAVKPAVGPALDRVATALQRVPRAEVRIVGHTDSRGDPAANDNLSVDRAASVRDWLVMRGIPAPRFSVSGRGARDPLANNDTDAGRASNRRVEILVGEPSR